MGEISDKVGVPLEMPEVYHKAFKENSTILEQLFGVCGNPTTSKNVSSTVGSSEESFPENSQHLLHFLDVYIEIFDYVAKHTVSSSLTTSHVVVQGNSPIIKQCITKFREIFRQNFRGVHYLAGKKLEQVAKKAEVEALIYFELLSPLSQQQHLEKETEKCQLNQIMSLEQSWIEKINEHRQNKDFEVILLEAVEKFKILATLVFPYLYDNIRVGEEDANVTYCEESVFQRKLEEMMAQCRTGLCDQIPFKRDEDNRVLEQLCVKLDMSLEKNIVNDLKSRNSAKMIGIQAYMENLVEKSAEKYEQTVSKFLTEQPVQMNMELLLGEHTKLVEEFRPKFVLSGNNERNVAIGTQEYQAHCLNSYSSKTYETFQNLVKSTKETAQLNLVACQEESSVEIDNCLKNVTEIFGKYGMTNFNSGLRSYVEEGLKSIFNHVRVTNESSIDALLQSAKPVTILTKDETQYTQLMQKFMETYSNKLIAALQESKNFPYSVDSFLLQASHVEAKKKACEIIQEQNEPAYLGKLCAFLDYFILKATDKVNILLLHRSTKEIGGIPTPFNKFTGTDTVLENGAAININVNYQFITAMPQYLNKSFEELQLEDKICRCSVIQKITELFNQSAVECELVNSFERTLMCEKTSGQDLPQQRADPNTFTFSPQQYQGGVQGVFEFYSTPSSTNLSPLPKKAIRRKNK